MENLTKKKDRTKTPYCRQRLVNYDNTSMERVIALFLLLKEEKEKNHIISDDRIL